MDHVIGGMCCHAETATSRPDDPWLPTRLRLDRHFRRLLCLMLCLTFVPQNTAAGEDARMQLFLLEDPEGKWGVDDVAVEPVRSRFVALPDGPVNIGFSASVWWLRLRLDLPAERDHVVQLDYAQLDRLEFFLPAPNGWRVFKAGDTRPASVRPIHHPVPVFPLPADYTGDAWLRVESEGAILLPVRLWETEAFLEETARTQLGYGLYFAILLGLAVYNIFLYASIRDIAYLWYVLFLFGMVVFQATYSGHATLWLWPNSPLWANHAVVIGTALMLAAGARFTIQMAQTRIYTPYWHVILQGLSVASALLPVLLVIDYRAGTIAATLMAGATLILSPVPVTLSYLRGCRSARFVLLGLLLFLPGGILFALKTLNLAPSTWLTEHALQLGTVAEVMMLSLALADRINLLTREKDAAQRGLLDAEENERRRIAHELHDGLGQNLLVLSNRLKRLREGSEDIDAIEDQAATSLQELRRISRNLYPPALDRLGLNAAIASMLEHTLVPAGIEYRCDLDDVELARRDALQVFRMVQEGISNVVRHADSSRVTVSMRASDAGLTLEIVDDGVGLSKETHHTLGMTGMRERAERLKGSLSISGLEEGGTRIRLECPMPRFAEVAADTDHG